MLDTTHLEEDSVHIPVVFPSISSFGYNKDYRNTFALIRFSEVEVVIFGFIDLVVFV